MGHTKDSKALSGQFEALFHYATIGILISNRQGMIVKANNMLAEEFGYTMEELEGGPVDMLLPDQYSGSHAQHREGFYHRPKNRSMGSGRDLFARRKDGTQFPVEISLSHYSINDEIYVIAFVIDISVRKKSEQEMLRQQKELENKQLEITKLNRDLELKVEDRTKMLREALRELEASKEELSASLEKEKELSDLKSRFVTTASHEFRTPLSTILSSVSLIAKYTESSEQEKRDKHIKRIRDSVENMKNILEDFLSLGKLEEGLIHVEKEQLSKEKFVASVQALIDDMHPICKTGQQILLKDELNDHVETDLRLFRNILTNLISNAIKFSPEQGAIQVRLFNEGSLLVCSVKDDGIGISQEDQAHLFERFFRAKNATNIQGTGLGLHIIVKYLELMGGWIRLQSELNHGTEFTFYIARSEEN